MWSQKIHPNENFIFLEEIILFTHFRTLSDFLASFWKLSSEIVKTAFYVFIANFWWLFLKKTFKLFILFRTMNEKIVPISGKILGRVVTIAFYVSTVISLRILLFEKVTIFSPVRTMSGKNSAFCGKTFGAVVKPATYVSKGKFWWQIYISKYCMIFHISFGHGTKKPPAFYQRIPAGLSNLLFTFP